mmetsp:Transcript_71843/g.233491  ORF Transcript_71843/g.233491 Transcript_71843/m.233491 type:complete len:245 (+) Transcript_71843:1694-2428(+)
MKPKGCRSGSRGRSKRGPTSPFSAISASSSAMISAMMRRTDLPCWGTSPFTAMCSLPSMGSVISASLPLTPRPRKKTRAPLSVSMRRWLAPPRPMMRLRTLEPYMPFVRRLSKNIFSCQGYLFSGMVGGDSLGNFGATYGLGGKPGGGGGVSNSMAFFCGGFISKIEVAMSSRSSGQSAQCSASSLTIFWMSRLCLARSKSSKPSSLMDSCSKEERTPRCSCAGLDFFQSLTLRQTFFTHSSSG